MLSVSHCCVHFCAGSPRLEQLLPALVLPRLSLLLPACFAVLLFRRSVEAKATIARCRLVRSAAAIWQSSQQRILLVAQVSAPPPLLRGTLQCGQAAVRLAAVQLTAASAAALAVVWLQWQRCCTAPVGSCAPPAPSPLSTPPPLPSSELPPPMSLRHTTLRSDLIFWWVIARCIGAVTSVQCHRHRAVL